MGETPSERIICAEEVIIERASVCHAGTGRHLNGIMAIIAGNAGLNLRGGKSQMI